MAVTRATLERLSRDLRADAGDGADRRRGRPRRRGQGAYFTPTPLVKWVVREAVGAWFAQRRVRWRDDGSPIVRILDPAAGDGRFLVSAIDHLVERAGRRGIDTELARRAIARRCVVGIERDPAFARTARGVIGADVVHCCEALTGDPIGEGAVDVVVGNPPYLRSLRFAGTDRQLRDALRGRYAATSHGEWDLYAAFLEHSLRWVRPGGEIGLVVPSRWWTAAAAQKLRALVASGQHVRALVDFGSDQVFPDATTYASIAFLSNAPRAAATVARRGDGWSVGEVPSAELSGTPWRLSVGRRRELLEEIAGARASLGSVARIAKGAGTNADPVYVFEGAAPLEAELLRPAVRGRDIRPFSTVDGRVRCLVPYHLDGRLIDADELDTRYPRAAAYLRSRRHVLERRESGRFRGPTFYRFGRPQNMAFLGDPAPKVIVPDVAKEGRALLDDSGAMVLDSAYAVRATGDVELEFLLALLASRLVGHWLRETGAVLRGGYVRMKTAYLRSLPVPEASSWRRRAGAAARAGADPNEVDDLVRRAFGLSRDDWDSLRS